MSSFHREVKHYSGPMAHPFIDSLLSPKCPLTPTRLIIGCVADCGFIIVLHVLRRPHLGLWRTGGQDGVRLVIVLLLLIPVREVVVLVCGCPLLVSGGPLVRWWWEAVAGGGQVARGSQDLLNGFDDCAVVHLPCLSSPGPPCSCQSSALVEGRAWTWEAGPALWPGGSPTCKRKYL